jgi:hypothetical protein
VKGTQCRDCVARCERPRGPRCRALYRAITTETVPVRRVDGRRTPTPPCQGAVAGRLPADPLSGTHVLMPVDGVFADKRPNWPGSDPCTPNCFLIALPRPAVPSIGPASDDRSPRRWAARLRPLPGWIIEFPVHVAFAWVHGTRVVAPHRDDHVGLAGHFGAQRRQVGVVFAQP